MIKNKIDFGVNIRLLVPVLGILLFACIKPHYEEEYPAVKTDLCSDNIFNNGEYFTDCGGPCAPCASGDPVVSFQADSTWLPDNPNNKVVNCDYSAIAFTQDFIIVTAGDTFGSKSQSIALNFTIQRDWGLGVHVADSMLGQEYYYHNPPNNPPGQVFLSSGTVSITNIDTVNNLMAGRFEFNSQPSTVTGYRVAIINGFFKDVPIKP